MVKYPHSVWTAFLSLSVLYSAASADIIPDTIAPTIMINGDHTVSIKAGETYTDAGVITSDNQDGTISVKTLSSVNTTKAGEYSVTYLAKDSSGNRSKAFRTVKVTDNTPPQISLNGEQSITIEAGDGYLDPGVSCTDSSGGAVTINSVSNINLKKAGVYSVIYTATDLSGNQAGVKRQIIVKQTDKTPPVITLNGRETVILTAGTTYTDAGAVAIDNVDGEVAVVADSSKVNTDVAGAYVVDYEATDAAGNIYKTSRTVIVEEALVAKPPAPAYGEMLAHWSFDESDGALVKDLSGQNNHLKLTNVTENSRVAGKFEKAIELDANRNQDASTEAATLVLQPQSVTLSAWINPAQSKIEWEWVAAQGDNYGLFIEPESRKLVFYKKEWTKWTGVKSAENAINFNTWQHVAGTFDAATGTTKIYVNGVEVGSAMLSPEIVYSEGDGFTIGSMQGERYFTGKIDDVSVYNSSFSQYSIEDLVLRSQVDLSAPVISFIGGNHIKLVRGSDFTDSGVSAVDNVDGQLVASSDASQRVDTSELGSYQVTYIATDAAGNMAKATRTVEVIAADVIAPVITLEGANPVLVSKGSRYTDKGATAVDDVDSVVSVNVDTSQVDTSMAGQYEVIFTATDQAYNQQIRTRKVIVTDNPATGEFVFEGSYDGTGMPEESRRGSIEFNDYVDPNDPGARADWLTDSKGDILPVTDDVSFTHALRSAQPGDRIQLQSGVYKMQPIEISGLPGQPVTIESKAGNWAVFDGSLAGSASQMSVTTAWVNFRNFEVKNGSKGSLYVTHTHHSLFEGLKVHNNTRGFDLTDGSHHCLVRYSESYYNFDPANHGQDGDGFGVWSEGPYNDAIGEGVILEHNIAWGNADDGIDMWMNEATVTLRNNISRHNGYNVLNDPDFVGNGNGFKLGPLGTGHIVIGNIADDNPANGFDYNGGTDAHYVKGNVSTNNGMLDYDIPHRSVFMDNYKTGGELAE